MPVAIEKDLKIVYLCRTHSQSDRVIEELFKISENLSNSKSDVRLNGLSIRGRNEMCLNKTLIELKATPSESMSICADLRKNQNCPHFINLLKKKNKNGSPLLISPELFKKPINADDLINFCRDQKLCPYFLSKFLLSEMMVIICNYQWIFNPFIKQSFLTFIGRELEKCVIVIDECHNIIDVATEVNSAVISPFSLNLCLRDLEQYRSPEYMQTLVKLLQEHLNRKKNKINVLEKAINPTKFLEIIINKLGLRDLKEFEKLISDIYEFGLSIHEEKLANGQVSRAYLIHFADFWFKWLKTHILDNYFFCYSLIERKNKKNLIRMEIVALDPREITIPVLKNCYSSLHLSGTVNPFVYNNLMGLNKSGKSYKGIVADSPFDKENIKALITEGVDTRRENRKPFMFKKMIQKIDEVLYCTPANSAIFCASYRVLKSLLDNKLEEIVKKNNKKLFIEQEGTSATENALMIQDYKSMAKSPNKGGVLLGVCGGRNSEGEDYPGDYMNSIIVAGFPYHLPTPRIEAKIRYYDDVFDNQGWNFAYLYPAIQRANQASGRPIRKVNDKGSIIFMDSRFKDKFNWISRWIRKEIEIIPDKKNAIAQSLYPFWNE